MRLFVILMILASAAASNAEVTDFRMSVTDGATPPPIRFTGKTRDEHKRDLAVYLKDKYPDFDAEDPACKSILWFFSCWTSADNAGGFALSAKYHDIGVNYFNQCQEISTKLARVAHLPGPFKTAWRRRYAFELIEMRMYHRTDDEIAWLSAIPAGSTLIQVKNSAELVILLEKAYPDIAELHPLLRKMRYDKLAAINPGFDPAGYYITSEPDAPEPMPHATISSTNHARVCLYSLDPTMPMLLPPKNWFDEASVEVPAVVSEPSADSPEQVIACIAATNILPDGVPLNIYIAFSNAKAVNAWATVPTVNNRPYPAALRPGGSAMLPAPQVSVSCTVPARAISYTLSLDIKLATDMNAVTGSCSGKLTMDGASTNIACSVSGRLLAGGTAQESAVAGSWPWLYGPLNSNSSDLHGLKLVEDIRQARLAWVSADTIPCGRGPDTRGNAQCLPNTPLMGGWGSPVMANERVYLYYYEPNGTNYAWGAEKEAGKPGADKEHYRVNLIDADDVLHCFDVQTGKTVWRRTYRGQGLNWAGFNKAGPSPTPCIAVRTPNRPGPNRMCALGSAGKVYCVDADTGAALWESSIGRRARLMENHRKYLRASKAIFGSRDDFASALVPVGGAVVLCDHVSTKGGDGQYRYEMENGLLALDLNTGKRLWHLPQKAGHAMRWGHKGKEYLLAAGRSVIMCVEPMTGNVLWEAQGGNGGAIALPVTEDHLVCGLDGKLACYRISPEGATRVWAGQGSAPGVPPPIIHRGYVYSCGQGGVACIELATGKRAGGTSQGGWGLMVATGGRILLAEDQGHVKGALRWIRAEPPNVATLGDTWNVPLAGCYSVPLQPVMADGRMFVRFTDRLVCYDLRDANAVADRPHLRSKQELAAAAAAAAAEAARKAPPPKLDEVEHDLDLDL